MKGILNMRKRIVLSFFVVIALGILLGTVYFKYFYFEEPEDAIVKAMDSIVNQDAETAEKYVDYWSIYSGHSDRQLYEEIMRDFSYELKSVEQDGSSAVAELTVSNRDIEALYGQFVVKAYQLVISDAYQPEDERMGDAALKEEIDKMLLDDLAAGEAKMRSGDIEIEMNRKGRSWYLKLDHDDLDAIYGGYLSAEEAADNVLGDRSTEALANLEAAYQSNIDDANHVLRNAVHFMVDEIWNDLLCNIVSCINAGTDVNGEDYDLEAGMEQLQTLLAERESYDTYISGLDDVNYSQIKESWKSLTDSCDELVQELLEEQPEPVDYDYLPDTTAFENAMKEFVALIYPQED